MMIPVLWVVVTGYCNSMGHAGYGPRTNTVDFSASVPAPDASPQTVALIATAAKTAMYVGTTLSPDPAVHWAKEAYLPGVEWTKGKWAVAIFEFTAEKDGDLSLQVDQVIQLECALLPRGLSFLS